MQGLSAKPTGIWPLIGSGPPAGIERMMFAAWQLISGCALRYASIVAGIPGTFGSCENGTGVPPAVGHAKRWVSAWLFALMFPLTGDAAYVST